MEEIYSLICVLFIIVVFVSNILESKSKEEPISELRSCHRYAVADEIMSKPFQD